MSWVGRALPWKSSPNFTGKPVTKMLQNTNTNTKYKYNKMNWHSITNNTENKQVCILVVVVKIYIHQIKLTWIKKNK
jgi:hypothetical protein